VDQTLLASVSPTTEFRFLVPPPIVVKVANLFLVPLVPSEPVWMFKSQRSPTYGFVIVGFSERTAIPSLKVSCKWTKARGLTGLAVWRTQENKEGGSICQNGEKFGRELEILQQ